ncbi:MAG: magnesium/cobalt transporter CorA, partial [Nannocystaceae bacterium]
MANNDREQQTGKNVPTIGVAIGAALGTSIDRALGRVGSIGSRLRNAVGLQTRGEDRPGAVAGIEGFVDNANLPDPPVAIQVIDYGEGDVVTHRFETVDALLACPRAEKTQTRWINVDGLHSRVVARMQKEFRLHTLAAEDVLHAVQRPRIDDYDEHLVAFVRMLRMDEGHLHSEQVTLFLSEGTLLTFQEATGDVWEPIRRRLHQPGARLRSQGADFLLYALLDALVDHGFPVLETYGTALEELEVEVLGRATPSVLARIYGIKRELGMIRRVVWPLREVVDTLARGEDARIGAMTRTYLKDVREHAMRLVEITELHRELASGTMDLYMSVTSNRMNEVMKVLTIISTIFIPLSFIAGVYGMNFNPEVSPLNMPETQWVWGYPFT